MKYAEDRFKTLKEGGNLTNLIVDGKIRIGNYHPAREYEGV
jgi:hypothetical protein